MSTLIAIIVWIVLAAIVLWLAGIIAAAIPGTPPRVRTLVIALVGLLLLLAFLNRFGALVGLRAG